MDYWVEILEQWRVPDPETGVFYLETMPDRRKVEWVGDAASPEDAEEAGMADFEARHAERPQYYFSSVNTADPNRSGPRITARPGGRRYRAR
jgi:hypothetical protein